MTSQKNKKKESEYLSEHEVKATAMTSQGESPAHHFAVFVLIEKCQNKVLTAENPKQDPCVQIYDAPVAANRSYSLPEGNDVRLPSVFQHLL